MRQTLNRYERGEVFGIQYSVTKNAKQPKALVANFRRFDYIWVKHIEMNSPEIKQFIKEHSNLFWYTPDDKKEEISNEFLVETILNYGDINSITQLFNLLGIKKVAKIFFDTIALSNRRKGNYHELTVNYFTLVFRKYAH